VLVSVAFVPELGTEPLLVHPPSAARELPPTTIDPFINAFAAAWIVFVAPSLKRPLSI
jgi:hypothetical protein